LPVDGKKVVEHRITLGTFERKQLEKVSDSVTFENVVTPIVDLMKDVTGMAALYIILNALFPNWSKGLDLGILDSTNEKGWRDYIEAQNLAGIAVGGATGAWYGAAAGPWGALAGAIFGALGGTAVVEGAEEIYQDAAVGVRRTMFMLSLRRAATKEGLVE
jgi:hypothetical protein